MSIQSAVDAINRKVDTLKGDPVGAFIFGGKCVGQIGSTEAGDLFQVNFDVVTDEDHSFDATITDNPVERGSDVTDNIVLTPDRLTLSGFVSDNPVVYLSPFSRPKNTLPRSLDTKAMLLSLRNERVPFTVITGLHRYDSMFFESLSFPRKAGQGAVLYFSAKLRRIEVVESEIAPAPEVVTTPRAAAEKKDGPKPTTESTKAAESPRIEQRVSLLKRAGRAAKGIVGNLLP